MSKDEVSELVKEIDQKLNLNMNIEFELQYYNASTHAESNTIWEDGKAKGYVTCGNNLFTDKKYVAWTDALVSMLIYPEAVEYTDSPYIYLEHPFPEETKQMLREMNKDKKIIHVHFRTARWSWKESMGKEGHLFIDLVKPEQIYFEIMKRN